MSVATWIRPRPDTEPAGIFLSLAIRASLVLTTLQGCTLGSSYIILRLLKQFKIQVDRLKLRYEISTSCLTQRYRSTKCPYVRDVNIIFRFNYNLLKPSGFLLTTRLKNKKL